MLTSTPWCNDKICNNYTTMIVIYQVLRIDAMVWYRTMTTIMMQRDAMLGKTNNVTIMKRMQSSRRLAMSDGSVGGDSRSGTREYSLARYQCYYFINVVKGVIPYLVQGTGASTWFFWYRWCRYIFPGQYISWEVYASYWCEYRLYA